MQDQLAPRAQVRPAPPGQQDQQALPDLREQVRRDLRALKAQQDLPALRVLQERVDQLVPSARLARPAFKALEVSLVQRVLRALVRLAPPV